MSLRNLWKARQQNPKAEPTSQNDYEPLLNELSQATKDQLLDLKYSFFDKKGHEYVTQRVKDTLQAATAQLDRYISITSHGQGESAHPGVLDHRILCRNGGQDVLWDMSSYVLLVCGSYAGRRRREPLNAHMNLLVRNSYDSLKNKATQLSV